MIKLKDWDGKTPDVVILGSMEDVVKKMKLTANLVVTSPPYGVGKIPQKKGTSAKRQKTVNQEYDSIEDSFSEEQYEKWLGLCLKTAPVVFWNVPAKQARPFGTDRVKPFGQVIWTKAMGTIPFATKGVIYAHEYVWLVGNQESIRKPVYSVWNFPAQRYSKHPAPFPVEIPARAIHHATKLGDLVFDPFCGSGTTAAVAKAMGRRFITCDVSEEYCQWATERINETKVLGDKDGTQRQPEI